MFSLKSWVRKFLAFLLLVIHSIPTYACVANPLIGMIAPLGVEWFLLSPWSPFYRFWETRWLVFNMISLPELYGVHLDPIIGWSLTLSGICIFIVAAVQFFMRLQGKFVSSGLYSTVRHPQYLGIIIATLGFTVTSERPMAWISWLTLTFLYILLASSEDKLLQKRHGEEAEMYKEEVPFILPRLRFNKINLKLPEILEKKCARYVILLVIYLVIIIILWIFLKQFSYNPGPFWQ